jgi:transposase InsO family protein
MGVGFPNFKVEKRGVYKGCALGKNVKVSFQSREKILRGILDLIHLDVCGPMSSTSMIDNFYYVTFIDDSSRRTWIYFMKAKDEVFSKFQEFKALIKNQTCRKIKVLRSDNGGQYTSNDFDSFCIEACLKRGFIDTL